ncbi:hypothetical protein CYMTET_46834 [Cymbomonas tetramitiformis]|uniref:Uncharacterized protein n=1 Tax=Cymbomonas tetramitiformis TaxID=36881 RepID=A0AAE0EWQ1_9CHLO|nr:hypothetical protein CYMTET_46834 [Cymbomonas tetramitiformis]|eukprot:gene34406-biopygen28868
MLRSFVDGHPEDWDLWCTNVEFAINDSRSESTGFSPLEMVCPTPPMSQLDLFVTAALDESPMTRMKKGGEGVAVEFSQRFRVILEEARHKLEMAQQRQRAQFNSRHQQQEHQQQEHQLGDRVWVEARHLTGRVKMIRRCTAHWARGGTDRCPLLSGSSVTNSWPYQKITAGLLSVIG